MEPDKELVFLTTVLQPIQVFSLHFSLTATSYISFLSVLVHSDQIHSIPLVHSLRSKPSTHLTSNQAVPSRADPQL